MDPIRHSAPSAPAWMVAVSLFVMVLLGVSRPHLRPVVPEPESVPLIAPVPEPRGSAGAADAIPHIPSVAQTFATEISDFEQEVRALESRQCPEMSPRGEAPEEDEHPVEIQITSVSPNLAFAFVTTPCHQNGAYNFQYSVYVSQNGRIEPARFASIPRWAELPYVSGSHRFEPADPPGVWNPSLSVSEEGIVLSTILVGRGLGDSGEGYDFVWADDHFALLALHLREGGHFVPEDTGTFPIVAPASRRCSGVFELARNGRTATLATYVGEARSVASLAISEADCVAASDTISCGREQFRPHTEYALVTRGDDWVVLRLKSEEAQEVLRVPRGCAL